MIVSTLHLYSMQMMVIRTEGVCKWAGFCCVGVLGNNGLCVFWRDCCVRAQQYSTTRKHWKDLGPFYNKRLDRLRT